MTEEEKKAIEKIKKLEKLTREESKERNLKETQKLYKEYADYYLIILNLIEKLQKENEELKNKVIKRDNDIIYLEESAEKEFLTKQEVKENYIPKDKIRELATKLDKETDWLFEEEGSWSYCEPFRDIAKELEKLSKEE